MPIGILEKAIARLEEMGHKVARYGNEYRSQCPAHHGKNMNFAFSEGDDGRLLATCHSKKCSFEEIVKALNLSPTETIGSAAVLGPPSPAKEIGPGGKKVHRTLKAATLAAAFGIHSQLQREANVIFRYHNPDGSENLFACRWDLSAEEQRRLNISDHKQIRYISRWGSGYVVGTDPSRIYPIYRIDDLKKQIDQSLLSPVRIFICEGEKATEKARELGLPATTSPFGSGSARKADWTILDRIALGCKRQLDLVILPDNDDSGQEYAESLVGIFDDFHSRAIVRIVSFADSFNSFPTGGDLCELCELLDSKTDEEIREYLNHLADTTQPTLSNEEEEQDVSVFPWRPFPMEVLPQTLRDMAHEVSRANLCNPAAFLIAAFPALGAAIGNSRRIKIKEGWIFPAIIWGILIGKKGTAKTWAMAPAIKPLKDKQDQYHREFSREVRKYERERKEFECLKPSERRNHPFRLRNTPRIKRICQSEPTIQKIVKDSADNPRGFIIFSEEITSLLGGLSQYSKDGKSGGSQAILNTLFNGEGIESERIGDTTRYAPQAFVNIVGSVQPKILSRYLTEEAFDSGFASRFLMVAPPRRISKWSQAIISPNVEQRYRNLIEELLQLEMVPEGAQKIQEWNSDGNDNEHNDEEDRFVPMIVQISPEALEYYMVFFDEVASEMEKTTDENLCGAYEKQRVIACRLALILHLVRVAEQNLELSNNPDPETSPWYHSPDWIDPMSCDIKSMSAAIEIVRWFQ
ncbi:MAG: DUF3987 domain-containing protein, partial [Planctomycetia bacterium]|nr:DUF3987 domain-containing protein [Planctomycetia bacterium]